MFDNEKLNDHFEIFIGQVVAEIRKRNVHCLTEDYLDDIFLFVAQEIAHKRYPIEPFQHIHIKDTDK